MIKQSSTKALWASEITFGKINFKQLELTFDMIRDITLAKH